MRRRRARRRITSGGDPPVPGFPWTRVPITAGQADLITSTGDPSTVFGGRASPSGRRRPLRITSGGDPPVPGFPWTRVPITREQADTIASTGDPSTVFGGGSGAGGTGGRPGSTRPSPWGRGGQMRDAFLEHMITDPDQLTGDNAPPAASFVSDMMRAGSIQPDERAEPSFAPGEQATGAYASAPPSPLEEFAPIVGHGGDFDALMRETRRMEAAEGGPGSVAWERYIEIYGVSPEPVRTPQEERGPGGVDLTPPEPSSGVDPDQEDRKRQIDNAVDPDSKAVLTHDYRTEFGVDPVTGGSISPSQIKTDLRNSAVKGGPGSKSWTKYMDAYNEHPATGLPFLSGSQGPK